MGAEIERHAHGFRKMIVGRNGRPETPSKNLLRVKQSPFPSEPYA